MEPEEILEILLNAESKEEVYGEGQKLNDVLKSGSGFKNVEVLIGALDKLVTKVRSKSHEVVLTQIMALLDAVSYQADTDDTTRKLRYETLRGIYTNPDIISHAPKVSSVAGFIIRSDFTGHWENDSKVISCAAKEPDKFLGSWLNPENLRSYRHLADHAADLFLLEKPGEVYIGELQCIKEIPVEQISLEVFKKLRNIAERPGIGGRNPWADLTLQKFVGVDGDAINGEILELISEAKSELSCYKEMPFSMIGGGTFNQIVNTVFTFAEIESLVGNEKWKTEFASSEKARNFCLNQGSISQNDRINNNMWTLRFLLELRGSESQAELAIRSMEAILKHGRHAGQLRPWRNRIKSESHLLSNPDLKKRLNRLADS